MKILIAVITYNEENNLQKVIDDLKENNFGYDIVVIDNASYDKSYDICKKNKIDVIRHCVNSDINGTWKTYFRYAFENNYDIVCQFDGDGQHMASELRKIIHPILNKEANQVIGSRFLIKNGFRSFFIRRLGIRLFSFLISLIAGYKILDVTSGFIAFDRNTIAFFACYYKMEINDPNQTHLLSIFSGSKIIEVPVLMKSRAHGKSLYNIINSFVYPFNGMANILGCLLLKNQIQKEWRNINEQ